MGVRYVAQLAFRSEGSANARNAARYLPQSGQRRSTPPNFGRIRVLKFADVVPKPVEFGTTSTHIGHYRPFDQLWPALC